MGSVSAMGGQGNCVSGTSPLTCVTLYILSLPILALHTPLSLSLPPPIPVAIYACPSSCALLTVLSCTLLRKPHPCAWSHRKTDKDTVPHDPEVLCLMVGGADICQEIETCL